MQPLILSTYDTAGGAAKASLRLHQGLRQQGISSRMLVQAKLGDESTVSEINSRKGKVLAKVGHALDAVPPVFYRNRQKVEFSTQWAPDAIGSAIKDINPDLVNLHWTNESFVKIESLRAWNKPLVWTLHDMWAFTGGCHYNQDCERYTQTCGNCPQLGSDRHNDLSHWVWQRKRKAWQALDLTIVTPSAWMAQCAKSSSLFKDCRVETIPNGIDIQTYRPIEQKLARHLLGLPQDKALLLFGAVNATSSPRKGFHLLQDALQNMQGLENRKELELMVVGASRPQIEQDTTLKAHYLGKLSDDISLALVYSAADVFVAPSTQDNLPNTLVEAMACGVPCVAFKVGGISEIIDHEKNGYLAKPFDTIDLARGINWVLEDFFRYKSLKSQSRKTATYKFSREHQASRYTALFESLIT